MRKILIAAVILTIGFLPGIVLADIPEVTSTDLIGKAKELDGLEVSYTGEVIGDILKQGDHTWINVSDGVNAIGVFLDNKVTQAIELAGRYGMHGDTVRITGIFSRACPDHGGDLDIHATGVELTAAGYPVMHTAEPQKVIGSVILLAGTVMLTTLLIKKKQYS